MTLTDLEPFDQAPTIDGATARVIEQATARRAATLHLISTTGEELPDLVALLTRRPAWHAHAACRGVGPALFYLERGGDPRPGKALCAACTVRPQCHAQALEGNEAGIWAGLSAQERRVVSVTRSVGR